MTKKWLSILSVIMIIVIGFSQKESWLELVRAGGIYSIIFSCLIVAVCVFFPIVPFAVIAGLNGAVFGITNGALITLSGSMLGTMMLFFLARYGFRDWAEKKMLKYPKMNEYEGYFNQNAFTAVLLGRLIPVIPSVVMNIVCGLSKVKWLIFFVASTLGKIPNVFVISIAGANFNEHKLISFAIYGVYMLIIMVIIYKKYPHFINKNNKAEQSEPK
ncbi:TVP38/TMEM64 family protein [Bacillus sp. CLL-7-23]|uniref:TVP38/TMEM64 family membrane protein n=1 Tax=Bacillus changyiensis TaxID=3004103 RepID=A0ABT4X0M0_9BACI|nr:TVP38/TMEM64 family protein [Bacillus changyiensis]MDA7025763.1 TVP38/TMEM64 family protein [Bacillus changyiensis]